jgi:hypothetical protein
LDSSSLELTQKFLGGPGPPSLRSPLEFFKVNAAEGADADPLLEKEAFLLFEAAPPF